MHGLHYFNSRHEIWYEEYGLMNIMCYDCKNVQLYKEWVAVLEGMSDDCDRRNAFIYLFAKCEQ